MSLYSLLALYEADLEKIEVAIQKIDISITKTTNLKKLTLDTIMVDNKPYKEELIDKTINHLVKAKEYLSGTALPSIRNKIDEIKAEIKRMEEEEKRKQEEAQQASNTKKDK